MAADWMPVRLDLTHDPAVLTIARITGLDEHGVVGRLVAVWAWANAHTTDGNASGNALGVTVAWLDRFVGAPKFARAMIAAGWLALVPATDGTDANDSTAQIMFPKFDLWNSEGAKRRILTTRRVQRHRAAAATPEKRDGNAVSVTPAFPKKRREEKSINPPPNPRPAGDGREPGAEDPGAEGPPDDGPAYPDFDHIEPPPLSEFLAAWAAAKLAPAAATATRRARWQDRWRDSFFRANWRAAVERAGRSKRCRPGGSWCLNCDSFLKDQDMARRILEGQFDDAAGGMPRAADADPLETFRRKHTGS